MDWEDDDEKTTVYDTVEEEAYPMPRPAAGTPMPPATIASAPPPSMPMARPPAAAQPSYAAPVTVPPVAHTQPSPAGTVPPTGGKRSAIIGVGIAGGLAAAAAIAFMAFSSPTSKLVVQLSGTDGAQVQGATMLVDGQAANCQGTLCQIDAEPGVHTVTINAPKYKELTHAVQVEKSTDKLESLQLTPASAGTGFKIASTAKGLTLFVNGKEVGPLPQELKNLPPGQHDVKVVGGKSFEDWTKKVTVSADNVADLGSVKLNVKEGTATIKLGKNAEGAKVLIVCGKNPGGVLTKENYGKGVKLPSEGCKIVAQRKGFAEVSQAVAFEPGEPTREFTIDFGSKKVERPVARPRIKVQPRVRRDPVKPPPPKPEKAVAMGTININSIPPSAVVLDGKPLGKTPRLGVKVKAGRHTVVFIHRKYGKRVKKITVKEGKRSAAIMNFKKKKK